MIFSVAEALFLSCRRFPPAPASLDRRTQQILAAQAGREDMKPFMKPFITPHVPRSIKSFTTLHRLHGLSYSSSLSEFITSSQKEKEHALEKNKCESTSWARMNSRSLQTGSFFSVSCFECSNQVRRTGLDAL